ncbi:type IV pilin protein [Teredinibacter sp. KSP-S5-2]|uniref:type IV pilin protein n=1 Tax=Teredinibacter sp. KSP-S5-2 TaxID=3034506 RepID=UPI002934A603|nr:type IV pilin protein [Teredinibacter sp. KSP-S5-2]WNO09865.1 type IV pilin protein [Teredinibacter sp. KSP-S5-2]
MNNMKGFTLIEVLLVVAIISILGSIAFSSYQSSIQKSNRADGKELLLRCASMQERNFLRFNVYSDDEGVVCGAGANTVVTSIDGHYVLNVENTNCPTAADNGQCFEMTATAQGSQRNDTTCLVLSLNQAGVKKSYSAYPGTETTGCW